MKPRILVNQETVELLSRSDPKRQRAQENSSMDRRSVEVSIEIEERKLVRNGNCQISIEKMSSLKKMNFSRKKTKK